MKMEEDNVHSNILYFLIELIYQIPYRGYNMQIKKLSEVYHLIQVNLKTIKGKDYGTLEAKLS